METILEVLQTDYLGLLATAIGLIYLYLEFKAKKSMWIASIIMAILYIYIFFKSEFYAMSLIYGYFFIISIWGWHKWHQKQLSPAGLDASQKSTIPLERMPQKAITTIISYLIISSLIIAGLLYLLTDTSWTILLSDTFATSLNVVAIWMATRRWAEQWSLLIPANLLTGIMLFIQAQYPSSIMFMIYFIVSIFGLFHWIKLADLSYDK
ncbi:nicotinamide riboside transporter PnuC [Ignatzschineria rhizosphaerae]|uniref:Nicotinamide riboside transporter PnuC n=1 Tax=Ignatzschineria rhizosphaerae TaxID=2923279 RepID=A0ABY3WYS0_9GAMM|nr:nicotinamide riboside transporter PnuC [Ignatzschineria rhizosphaerae]UNM95769.1 nicotinamide riboside transporter PnuC [Ignatzschineria rhizosphaerae]